MEVKVVVNLTPMRTLFYRLDPLLPLEELVVENYSTVNTLEHSTLGILINKAINLKFNTEDKVYPFNTLGTFYVASKFINTAKIFIDILTSILNREVSPYYSRIDFSKVVTKTDDSYLIEFTAVYDDD